MPTLREWNIKRYKAEMFSEIDWWVSKIPMKIIFESAVPELESIRCNKKLLVLIFTPFFLLN